jgi:hypothetical protein
MTAALTPAPKAQFFAANGTPLVGGKLYSYAAGTTTPLATYINSAGITQNTNPVILDSRGEANVWLDNGVLYKLALHDATDALIWTVDNVYANNTGIFTGPVAGTTGTFSGALTALSGAFSGNVQIASLNGGQLAGLRNRIINGNFSVNQRAVSGTVTLAAGAYGHDRWKAGAGGCTYTFATALNVTTITITAGTLQQVIEGANLESGTFRLSFTGTATARIDGGAYGLSGAAISGTAVGGTNQTVEFATGTVSRVQYELGSVSTPFEQRPIGLELALCQRYFYAYTCAGGGFGDFGIGYLRSTTSFVVSIKMPVPLRVAATSFNFSGLVGNYSYQVGGTDCIVNGISVVAYGADSSSVEFTSATLSTVGFGGRAYGNGGARTLSFNAEL